MGPNHVGQNLTEQECQLLQQIHNISRIDYPCTREIVHDTQPLIERGFVTQDGVAVRNGFVDLRIIDEARWAAIGAEHPIQDE